MPTVSWFSRHRHQWDIVGTSYLPPSERTFEGRGEEAAHLVQVMVKGLTTISLRCSECGNVATREVYGKWQEE